jgi:hypothetical protein
MPASFAILVGRQLTGEVLHRALRLFCRMFVAVARASPTLLDKYGQADTGAFVNIPGAAYPPSPKTCVMCASGRCAMGTKFLDSKLTRTYRAQVQRIRIGLKD